MTKTELSELVAQEHSLNKAYAGRVLDTVLEGIMATVKKGNSVTITGFGTFKQVTRAAREGVNPSTGAKIKIAASKAPKFTPGSAFKAAVNPKAAKSKVGKAASKA
jgi:DNA-binding protein HU-beta